MSQECHIGGEDTSSASLILESMSNARPARPSRHFIMSTNRSGSALDVVISGDLGRESVHHLEEMVAHLAGSLDQVVIDFTGLSSIDTAGLDALVRSSEALERRGVRVALKELPDEAMRRLGPMGLGSRCGYEVSFADESRGAR